MNKLLTRKQAAELLGMSESWIRIQEKAGLLPTVSLGRAVRIDEADLDRFIKARKSAVVETIGGHCISGDSPSAAEPSKVVEYAVSVSR